MADSLLSAPSWGKPLVDAYLSDLHLADTQARSYRYLLTNNLVAVHHWLGNDGPRPPMPRGAQGVWWAPATCPAGAALQLPLTVEARAAVDRLGRHQLRLAPGLYQPPRHPATGRDAASIGAWEANGILGTQLGSTRNAKPLKPS